MRFILLVILSAMAALPFVTMGGLTSVRAEPAPVNAAASADQAPVGNFIQTLGNQAIAVMADKSLTPEQRTQKYRALLHDSFDMPTIGHFVLGRAWATATPEQQKTFMQLFEQLVVETYGNHLNFYSGEGFQVKGARQESDKDSVFNSEVSHPDGSSPTAIDWRVRQQNGKLAIIDVVVAGVSQSITQRQEYAAIIQRNNGNIDGLLDAMKQRLEKPQP